jgi:hypothetical protein
MCLPQRRRARGDRVVDRKIEEKKDAITFKDYKTNNWQVIIHFPLLFCHPSPFLLGLLAFVLILHASWGCLHEQDCTPPPRILPLSYRWRWLTDRPLISRDIEKQKGAGGVWLTSVDKRSWDTPRGRIINKSIRPTASLWEVSVALPYNSSHRFLTPPC